MSIDALSWAFKRHLPPTTKLVLLALADHANEDGMCWPTHRRMTDRTGLSERAIQQHARLLVAAGLVVIETKPGERNRYRLMMAPPHDVHPHPRTTCTPPPQEVRGHPNHHLTVNESGEEEAGTPQHDGPGEAHIVQGDDRQQEAGSLTTRGRRPRVLRCPIPEAFEPSEKSLAWAQQHYPEVATQHETRKFRSYFAGNGKQNADWQATWRAWIARAVDFKGVHGTGAGSAGGRTAKVAAANRDRARAFAGREAPPLLLVGTVQPTDEGADPDA